MPYAYNGRISRDPISGGIEITEEQYQLALAAMLDGLQVSVDGGLKLEPPPQDPPTPEPEPPTLDEIRERAMEDIRAVRAPILNALAGIGFDALVAGDTVTASAVVSARNSLRDITVLPALLAATTYDDMKAAVMARYREIAAAVPVNVQVAFVEVFGR